MNKAYTKFIILLVLLVKIKIYLLKEIKNVTYLGSSCFSLKYNKRNNSNIVLYYYFIKKNIIHVGKKNICKKKLILLNDSTQNEDGNADDKNINADNKYISQYFKGISIFPIKQEDSDNPLRTKIPAREFKPKRSLGQNYLKDENIIRKMVEAVELDIDDDTFSKNNTKVEIKKQKKKGKKKKENYKSKKNGNNKISINEKKDDDKNIEDEKKDDDKNIEDEKKGDYKNIENEKKDDNNNIENEKKDDNKNIEDKKKGDDKNVEDGKDIRCENLEKYKFESIKNSGKGIIELGCGLGQISKFLFKKYQNMTGIEIDSRALSIISRTIPGFDFIHDDVLQVNYKELSLSKKTKLTVIGNLPFYITSQILFCLLDFYKYIEQAIVTIQYEVGQRIVAETNSKNYSILSILFSLYSKSYMLFKIPSKAFYPVPKVEAAVMKIIFKKENFNCNLLFLKKVLRYAFQQRRKKLKSSLKPLLKEYNIQQIPQPFVDLRPQQLHPNQFIELTNFLFPLNLYPFDPNIQTKVWRKEKHGE